MEQLAAQKAQQTARLHSLVAEVGKIPSSVVFCQVWRSFAGRTQPGDRNPVLLMVEAQSPVSSNNESIASYAHASAANGVRAQQMELLGDCRLKGAIRLIEDIENVDAQQHPRDKLPGSDIPACSALFLPIFDPADPLARRPGSSQPVPCGLLEVLVCQSVKMVYNHSDLINSVCQAMDKFEFAVSGDATAFKEWSRQIGRSRPGSPFVARQPSPKSSISRTSSTMLLTPENSDEMLNERGFAALPQAYPAWPRQAAVPMAVCAAPGLMQTS